MKSDRMRLWTVVPVRGLATGKSRLAPVLGRARRTALNRELLGRTLAVIGERGDALERCLVVSPCVRTLRLARAAGAATLREGTRPVGLNRAVALGIARAAAQAATHVLILPIDLPYLSRIALAELELAAHGSGRVVLAPDKAGNGTNAIVVEITSGFEFSFGAGSFAAHARSARRAGLTVTVVDSNELKFDLDTPQDLAAWQRARDASGSNPPRTTRNTGCSLSRGSANMRRRTTLGEESRR